MVNPWTTNKLINNLTLCFDCQNLKPKDTRVTLSDGRKITILVAGVDTIVLGTLNDEEINGIKNLWKDWIQQHGDLLLLKKNVRMILIQTGEKRFLVLSREWG